MHGSPFMSDRQLTCIKLLISARKAIAKSTGAWHWSPTAIPHNRICLPCSHCNSRCRHTYKKPFQNVTDQELFHNSVWSVVGMSIQPRCFAVNGWGRGGRKGACTYSGGPMGWVTCGWGCFHFFSFLSFLNRNSINFSNLKLAKICSVLTWLGAIEFWLPTRASSCSTGGGEEQWSVGCLENQPDPCYKAPGIHT